MKRKSFWSAALLTSVLCVGLSGCGAATSTASSESTAISSASETSQEESSVASSSDATEPESSLVSSAAEESSEDTEDGTVLTPAETSESTAPDAEDSVASSKTSDSDSEITVPAEESTEPDIPSDGSEATDAPANGGGEDYTFLVTNAQTPVYASPDAAAEELGTLDSGMPVVVRGQSEGWYEIEFQGGTGYAAAEYFS